MTIGHALFHLVKSSVMLIFLTPLKFTTERGGKVFGFIVHLRGSKGKDLEWNCNHDIVLFG